MFGSPVKNVTLSGVLDVTLPGTKTYLARSSNVAIRSLRNGLQAKMLGEMPMPITARPVRFPYSEATAVPT